MNFRNRSEEQSRIGFLRNVNHTRIRGEKITSLSELVDADKHWDLVTVPKLFPLLQNAGSCYPDLKGGLKRSNKMSAIFF